MAAKITQSIQDYNQSLEKNDQNICQFLQKQINRGLPEAESKVWHAHPVWFLNGNPIVGYSKQNRGVVVLFWSGQSFNEESLEPEGSFKAAQVCYTAVDQINQGDLERWLKKAEKIQWDYKNIVKHRGVLEKIS
jgi:hypothetical protein